MTKNSVLNALAASLYIALIASVMFFAPKSVDATPTVLVPIAVLSLFCLSAAVMAYIFFYNPVLMYLDGQKKEAVKLGVRTVGAFAVVTAIFLLALLFSNNF